jgi:hypothetical protein
MSLTEFILFATSVINAVAAAVSAWFAFKTVRLSKQTQNEQQKIREIEWSEQQKNRQLERADRGYEQQIAGPAQEYLAVLSTEWYGMLQQGLIGLDALIARKASKVETAAFSRDLTFSLRETWRRASFKLVIRAELNNRSLSRELEKARDALDEAVAKILNEHSARAWPGRSNVSLGLLVKNHSVLVLECIAKYAPQGEDGSRSPTDVDVATRRLGPGTAAAQRVQK